VAVSDPGARHSEVGKALDLDRREHDRQLTDDLDLEHLGG
jgi:hypothetical protein